MAAPLFLRAIPLLSLRLHHHHHRLADSILAPARRPWCSAAEPSRGDENLSSADNITAAWSARDSVSPKYHRWNDDEYRKWKDKEDEILRDIEPIASLTKEILHSERLSTRMWGAFYKVLVGPSDVLFPWKSIWSVKAPRVVLVCAGAVEKQLLHCSATLDLWCFILHSFGI
uniref:Uncharacterized protein n=1 Tax=Fagus sylvatica TaxID=28930 RepID=A0A2N9H6H3_FAGSY